MPKESSPAAKREILDALPRRTLLELLDRFELEVDDRRKRAEILDRLEKSRKANVPDVLDALSRKQLEDVCQHLGLDHGGRTKSVLVGRILGTEPVQHGLGLDRKRPTPEVRPDGTLTDEDAPVDELQPPPPEKLTVEALERYLWSAADILRGSIDSSDYKSYIFGLLFLKRLSDVFEEEAEKLIAEGEPERIAWESADEHQFFVPLQARWSKLQKTATNIGEALNKACSAVEEANSWALEGVLAGVDFNDERRLGDGKNRDSVLSRLVQHFSKVSLRNAHLSEPDMLGRAYEYLIERFADDAGKKGGEFYTPNKVVELIVELLAPEPGMRISDPTCGSGGMLIQCAKYVQKHGGNTQNLVLHGQEKNLGTWGICKMNMLLHGIVDHRIEKGDTIRDPKLRDGGELMLYDRVIANPPFSLDEWGIEVAESDPYGRFRFGLPPKAKGDLAFVQHMVATLNLDGRLGVVMPHGVLFRGSSEGRIRERLLEEDLFEAVIGLPPMLFYGTGIPASVLVLSRNKALERKGKVLFIDASHDFEAGSARNFLRDEDVQKMAKTFHAFDDVERYARVVELEEVQSNDGNLNISRYVDTAEETERIDLAGAVQKLRELEDSRGEAEATMNRFLKELGYGA
ncbi:MAG: class I SAM-dependent DNA methyltransferase [Myxococcota bacterium]